MKIRNMLDNINVKRSFELLYQIEPIYFKKILILLKKTFI